MEFQYSLLCATMIAAFFGVGFVVTYLLNLFPSFSLFIGIFAMLFLWVAALGAGFIIFILASEIIIQAWSDCRYEATSSRLGTPES